MRCSEGEYRWLGGNVEGCGEGLLDESLELTSCIVDVAFDIVGGIVFGPPVGGEGLSGGFVFVG